MSKCSMIVITHLKSMMAVVLPRDAHKYATRKTTRKVVANVFLFNLIPCTTSPVSHEPVRNAIRVLYLSEFQRSSAQRCTRLLIYARVD